MHKASQDIFPPLYVQIWWYKAIQFVCVLSRHIFFQCSDPNLWSTFRCPSQCFPSLKKLQLPSLSKLPFKSIDQKFLDKSKTQLNAFLQVNALAPQHFVTAACSVYSWIHTLTNSCFFNRRVSIWLPVCLQRLLTDERLCQSEALYAFLSPSPEHLKVNTPFLHLALSCIAQRRAAWLIQGEEKKVIFCICLMIWHIMKDFSGMRCSVICLISKVMSIQKKSSFSLASFLEKLPGDFFSHTEVSHHFFEVGDHSGTSSILVCFCVTL